MFKYQEWVKSLSCCFVITLTLLTQETSLLSVGEQTTRKLHYILDLTLLIVINQSSAYDLISRHAVAVMHSDQ